MFAASQSPLAQVEQFFLVQGITLRKSPRASSLKKISPCKLAKYQTISWTRLIWLGTHLKHKWDIFPGSELANYKCFLKTLVNVNGISLYLKLITSTTLVDLYLYSFLISSGFSVIFLHQIQVVNINKFPGCPGSNFFIQRSVFEIHHWTKIDFFKVPFGSLFLLILYNLFVKLIILKFVHCPNICSTFKLSWTSFYDKIHRSWSY